MSAERFDLGHGLVMQRTFAHFMAPFLMAFSPAEKGKAHPGPWSAVSDGLGFDIHIQLCVPSSFDQTNFFDRLNTVWWITALIRLRGASCAHVPVIADRSFDDIPSNWQDARMLPIEVLRDALPQKRLLPNSQTTTFNGSKTFGCLAVVSWMPAQTSTMRSNH
ncbi:MAG: hypothetical protein EHM80_15645 [Nitrospiraceae bacterium]|nr:MAG: hypothetical protein EHM80_15645 [Nitrospiraceae bacterium]